ARSFATPSDGCSQQPIPLAKELSYDFSSPTHDRGHAGPEPCSGHPTSVRPTGLALRATLPQVTSTAGTQRLWAHSAEFLLARSEQPPESPKDWRLDVKIACQCDDCRELQAFALDPASQTHRFRVKQERRQHLHNMIDRHRLDMTHVTERAGSPQTLVCKKDRRTFNRRMKRYQDEIAAMLRLVRLAPKAGGAALSERMEVAGKRAADLKQRAAPA